METIPSPQLGFLRGVFLANHLASTDNLTRTTKRQNTHKRKLTINRPAKSGPNKQQYTEKSILSERYPEPGLVTFYDIRPWNEAGLFLQPRRPHGVITTEEPLQIISARFFAGQCPSCHPTNSVNALKQ